MDTAGEREGERLGNNYSLGALARFKDTADVAQQSGELENAKNAVENGYFTVRRSHRTTIPDLAAMHV
jgi:hypothetical protein